MLYVCWYIDLFLQESRHIVFYDVISSKRVVVKDRLLSYRSDTTTCCFNLKGASYSHVSIATLLPHNKVNCGHLEQHGVTSHIHGAFWMSAKGFGSNSFNSNVQIFCDLTSAAADSVVIFTDRDDLWFFTEGVKGCQDDESYCSAVHCCSEESLDFPFFVSICGFLCAEKCPCPRPAFSFGKQGKLTASSSGCGSSSFWPLRQAHYF